MIYGNGKNFKLQYSLNGIWTDFHSEDNPLTELYSKIMSGFSMKSKLLHNGAAVKTNVSTGRFSKEFAVDFYIKGTTEDLYGGITPSNKVVRGVNYIQEEVIARGDNKYIRVYPDVINLPSMYLEANILDFFVTDFEKTTYSVCRLKLQSVVNSNSIGYSNDLTDVLTDSFKTFFYTDSNWTKGGWLVVDSQSVSEEYIAWAFYFLNDTASLDISSYIENNTTYLITFEEFLQPSFTTDVINIEFKSGVTVHKTITLSKDNLKNRFEITFTTGTHEISLETPTFPEMSFAGFRKLRIWKIS